MQATLDAFSMKPFTRALNCLSRYGDDVVIHATPDHVKFSATNTSKSAYAQFAWEKGFFSKYSLTSSEVNAQGQKFVAGQLMVKGILAILKHKTVEKTVDKCELSILEVNGGGGTTDDDEIDTLESRLVVRMHCKHGVVKTHRLLLSTPDEVQAPIMRESTFESNLTIGPKALKEMIDKFPSGKGAKSDPSLVWTFGDNEVVVKTLESSLDTRGRGMLSTELTISSDEFDQYKVFETPTTIAFHLREFNGTIAFAESMAAPLDLRFTDPTEPLLVDVEGDNFEALFLIATSQPPSLQNQQPQRLKSSQSLQPQSSKSSQASAPSTTLGKRNREEKLLESGRRKKPSRVVHATPIKSTPPLSRSHSSLSMPPPPLPTTRLHSHFPSTPVRHESSSSQVQEEQEVEDPLFLPASQPGDPTTSQPLPLSQTQYSLMVESGLGLENMTGAEISALLDDDGIEAELDLGASHSKEQTGRDEEILFSQGDLVIFVNTQPTTIGMNNTRASGSRSFQPLFDD